MTSDREGGTKEGRLREFGTDKGEGVQNPENFADVIYVRPLMGED